MVIGINFWLLVLPHIQILFKPEVCKFRVSVLIYEATVLIFIWRTFSLKEIRQVD